MAVGWLLRCGFFCHFYDLLFHFVQLIVSLVLLSLANLLAQIRSKFIIKIVNTIENVSARGNNISGEIDMDLRLEHSLSLWHSGLNITIGQSACWANGLMDVAGLRSNPGLEAVFCSITLAGML